MTIMAQDIVSSCYFVYLLAISAVSGIGMMEFAEAVKSLFNFDQCGVITKPQDQGRLFNPLPLP